MREGYSALEIHHHVGSTVAAEEIAARDDVPTILEFDDLLRLLEEMPRAVVEVLLAACVPGMHRTVFPSGKFNREVFFDRDLKADFPMTRLVDNPETPVRYLRLNRLHPVQDGARWQCGAGMAFALHRNILDAAR